jgi:hypothetical protein
LHTNYVSLINQIENIRQDLMKLQDHQYQSQSMQDGRKHSSIKNISISPKKQPQQ